MILPHDKENNDRELFDRISKNYAEKDLLGASRTARRQRLEETLRVSELGSSISILEVGCGAGFASEYLNGRYEQYTGIDYSEELINFAKSQNHSNNISFQCINIKDYKPANKFDVIFLIGVLHHIDEIESTLNIIVSMLRPGGVIICNEPHPNNPLITFARRIRKIVDPNYSEDQVELSSDQIINYYKIANLENIEIFPQGFLSTPFAEVSTKFQWFFNPLSKVSCIVDDLLSKYLPKKIGMFISWNIIAIGRKH